jgi:hypothetical protein
MNDKAFIRSWTPVRKGAVFCSPACGLGCLHVDYLAARNNAAHLAELLGQRWQPRVWENLGWHYAAEIPAVRVQVSPASGDGYLCIMNLPGKSFVGRGRLPQAAVAAAVSEANAHNIGIALALEVVGVWV